MTEVTLFKNVHGCVNAALKGGQTVSFIEGKFFTTDTRLEAELLECAKYNEHGVYIDVNEPTIDPSAATPMDQLKKKLKAELLAEMAAAGQLVIDAGTTKPAKLNLSTSEDVAGGANTTLVGQALAAAAEVTADVKVDEQGNPITEGSEATASPALSALERLKAAQSGN